MADGTELPTTGGGSASAPATAAAPTPDLTPPPVTDSQPYQPLSGAAIVAFALALIYTAIVVLGGVVALSSHTPWLLPLWTVVLPLLAAGVAFIARFQIRRSEGTKTGLKLTSWAVGLSAAVGVLYVMYYLGTFFAVRAQAITFADTWVKTLAEGKTDEAFFLTIKPPRKLLKGPEDKDEKAARRGTLERNFNNGADPSRPGLFTGFSGSELVRLLQGAPAPQIELTGVKDWDYDKGGYNVTLLYQVSNDLARFPLQVKVRGEEVEDKDKRSRQWHVVIEETNIVGAVATSVEYTEKGKSLFRHTFMAREAVASQMGSSGWLIALGHGQFDKVVAGTLDSKDRESYLKNLPRFNLGFVLADDGATYRKLKPLADARREVQTGGLVRIDDAVFWAVNAQTRAAAETQVKALFDPARVDPAQLRARPQLMVLPSMPTAARDEHRIRYGFDVKLNFPQEDGTVLGIEGRVTVGADLADLPEGKPSAAEPWRIESLELVRAKVLSPPASGGRGRPGG